MQNQFIRQIIAFASLALVALLAGCATAPKTPVRGVTSLTDHVTDGGQSFSLAYMPDAGKVSVHVIWPNDYAHSAKMPAVSSLGVELISSGGAGSRSAKKIKQAITALGSAASLVATPDHIYGTFTSSPETLDETIAIASDVITNPALDELLFDVIKEAKQKRIEEQQDKSSAKLWRTARQALLGDSTLTDYWNNTPLERVVSPLTIADVARWHKNTLTRQSITVAVAGSIEADVVSHSIDALLGGLPAEGAEVSAKQKNLQTGITVLLHDDAVFSTTIAVIGLLPASSEGGEIADIIAIGALGKGKDSRLLKAKSAELTDAVTISASIANFSRDVRVFGISVSADNESTVAALQLIEKTYKEFKEGALEDQEVLRSVVPFANSLRSNDKKVDLLAYGLGQLLLDKLPKDMLLTVMQDSLSLKADDINQRIVSRYPDWDDLVKVVLTNDAKIVEADCEVRGVEEVALCEW